MNLLSCAATGALMLTASHGTAWAGTACTVDSDCGVYATCEFNDDGSRAADADWGRAPERSSDASGMPLPQEGECTIDADSLPIDDDCLALCQEIAACSAELGFIGSATSVPSPTPSAGGAGGGGDAWSGSDAGQGESYADTWAGGDTADSPDASDAGSSDSDGAAEYSDVEIPQVDVGTPDANAGPTDEEIAAFTRTCSLVCSYGVVLEAETSVTAAEVLTCISDRQECTVIEDACDEELGAMSDVFRWVSDRVEFETGAGAGDGPGTTNGTTADTDGGSSNHPGTEQGGASATDDGCSSGGSGAAWPVAAVLAVLGLMRRRRCVLSES